MKANIAIILLAACLAGPAIAAKKTAEPAPWTQEPDSFMGVKMSSNVIYDLTQCPSGVLNSQQATMCYKPPYKDLYMIEGLPKIGLDYFYSLSVKVRDRAVEYFYLSANTRDFEKLSQVFIAKYGQPGSKVITPVKTKAGASFSNETLTWSGRKVRIVVQRYADDINTSSATISNIEATAKAVGDIKTSINQGASKL